ncbi:MAG TPA: DUF2459 domain-containing protein, partial [Steroidobacteraceae bacterium]|nr:DUF2459 domain-containing protein [Steroidobacteraceae bacterium]
MVRGRLSELGTPRTAFVGPKAAFLSACMLLGGCAETPHPAPTPPPATFLSRLADRPPEIGVLVAGWHTGLVLPADELGPLKLLLRTTKYVSFGWGNRRFYMAAHPGSGDAVAALFRSPGVLFIRAVPAPADLLASDIRIHWVCASRAQIWRADDYIEKSLSRPSHPVDLGPGPLAGSRFYASGEHYSAVHTCNTWTAAALEYAGLPVSARGVLFA